MLKQYRVKNVNDLDVIYTILRERHPENQIEIVFDWNTKIYHVSVTDEPYKEDPEVPVDLNIQVVYGDSVTGDTPLLLLNPKTNQITIKTIDSICDEWSEYPQFKVLDATVRLEKQYGASDLQVWCDRGWNPIKKIIRHKTNKKIHRVLTHTGVVDVTEDHSLLDENLNKVAPSELNIGSNLLHSFPRLNRCTLSSISVVNAYVYGFFFGCGSCNDSGVMIHSYPYPYPYKLKQKWDICYPNNDIQICYSTNELYTQSPQIVEEYRELFYNDEETNLKRVPDIILNSSQETLKSFMDGYWNATGVRCEVKGKIGAHGLFTVLRKLGYNVCVKNTEETDTYRLYFTDLIHDNQVKSISIVCNGSLDTYVYDIETEHGRLTAGVGNLMVSNTDSIFLRFQYNRSDFQKNRKDTFNLATICGDKLTEEIFDRPPIEMEFEKVFQPFVLLTKKRYIAKKYDDMKDPFKLKGIDAKGIALTRRDYCNMVKKCYKEIIDTIMDDNTKDDLISNSLHVFKGYITKIDNYQIEIDDLVVSAMLAKSYKSDNIAHVKLAKKLKERNEEVQVGDRIPYIFIESKVAKAKKSDLAEDPTYAVAHNLKFNRLCYLEQLVKPILGLYRIIYLNDVVKFTSILSYVNEYMVKFGGKALKPSDFTMKETGSI